MLAEMADVVEINPGAALEWVAGEFRMAGRKAGELGGVATLALLVGEILQPHFATPVFLVALGAGHRLARGRGATGNQGRQREPGGRHQGGGARQGIPGQAGQLPGGAAVGLQRGATQRVAVQTKLTVNPGGVRAIGVGQPSGRRAFQAGMTRGAFLPQRFMGERQRPRGKPALCPRGAQGHQQNGQRRSDRQPNRHTAPRAQTPDGPALGNGAAAFPRGAGARFTGAALEGGPGAMPTIPLAQRMALRRRGTTAPRIRPRQAALTVPSPAADPSLIRALVATLVEFEWLERGHGRN